MHLLIIHTSLQNKQFRTSTRQMNTWYSIVWICYIFFFHLSVDGHLGCFPWQCLSRGVAGPDFDGTTQAAVGRTGWRWASVEPGTLLKCSCWVWGQGGSGGGGKEWCVNPRAQSVVLFSIYSRFLGDLAQGHGVSSRYEDSQLRISGLPLALTWHLYSFILYKASQTRHLPNWTPSTPTPNLLSLLPFIFWWTAGPFFQFLSSKTLKVIFDFSLSLTYHIQSVRKIYQFPLQCLSTMKPLSSFAWITAIVNWPPSSHHSQQTGGILLKCKPHHITPPLETQQQFPISLKSTHWPTGHYGIWPPVT